MALYVGVDGGGSGTRVLMLDTEAATVVLRRGEASNPVSVGWETGCSRIAALITAGLAELHATPAQVHAVCAALAGLGRPADAARMHDRLHQYLPTARIEAVSDAQAALTAGTCGGPGIVLIAGTGTMALGEDLHGRVERAGGLGYLIGDEGSGFEIGRDGLRAAVQAHEGRGPATALWEAAKHYFDIAQPTDLVPAVYNSGHPVGLIASFARAVAEAASWDAVAAGIVEAAIGQHATLVDSLCKRLTFAGPPTVVAAGGLYGAQPDWLRRLQTHLPGCRCVAPRHSAAAGAALRAMLWDLAPDAPIDDAADRRAATVRLWERLVEKVEGHEQERADESQALT
jgi:N-acetylglucosamine kinase-like BadF-type ATPase